jgi:hypothetical protein
VGQADGLRRAFSLSSIPAGSNSMTRKLVLLNLTLITLVSAAAWQLRENWRSARSRDQAFAATKTKAEPAPIVPAAPPPAAVQAAAYFEVAQNMLFSKDRNPNVVVEPPAPKPVPPFPQAHGYMDLGAGPTIIMSERSGGPQKSYRQGDKVGSFQIAKLNRSEVVLSWEDKEFVKTMDDLKPKQTQQAEAAPPPPTGPTPQRPGEYHPPTTDVKVEQIRKSMQTEGLPGLEIGASARGCVPGDQSPSGTVMGGYRKVVTPTPFGGSCRWEPVR